MRLFILPMRLFNIPMRLFILPMRSFNIPMRPFHILPRSFPILRTGRSRRQLSFCCAALLVVFAAGCASPRPPRPPSLNLPAMVKDLSAQRLGDGVALAWSTPEKTTDRLDIKGPMTAEICRIAYPAVPFSGRAAVASAAPCVRIARLSVASGASHTADPLPVSLAAGPAALLAYRIEILNGHGRSAGLSAPAFAAAGAAPPAVEQLRAAASPSGVVVEWQRRNSSAGGSASVELDRLLASSAAAPPSSASNPASNPAPNPAPSPASSSPNTQPKPPAKRSIRGGPKVAARPGRGSAAKPLEAAPPPPAEVTLKLPAQAVDSGGVIDSTAAKGETYRYTAQRVLNVSLDGHSLTLRSLPSAPVTLVVRDLFPPARPSGLEAVPGEAVPNTAAESRSASSSIDLSWTPDTDADLAGYFVYRRQVSSTGSLAGAAIRLNQTPLVGPAYRDRTAVLGQRYAYRVTAVDASGNESKPSAEVQETLREP